MANVGTANGCSSATLRWSAHWSFLCQSIESIHRHPLTVFGNKMSSFITSTIKIIQHSSEISKKFCHVTSFVPYCSDYQLNLKLKQYHTGPNLTPVTTSNKQRFPSIRQRTVHTIHTIGCCCHRVEELQLL